MTEKSETPLPISAEEWAALARNATTPIDFDSLVAAGVIEKKGQWYKVHKWDELPEHAKSKIYAVKSGDTSMVKFRAPSRRLANLLKK